MTNSLRLVLNTSVIVSAFRSRTGASFRVLELLRQMRFIAVATPSLFLEYEAVLTRPAQRTVHGLSDERLDDALRGLAALLEPVRIDSQWRPQLPDPDDELVLEAAINGSVRAIITHNVSDFHIAAERFGIDVLTPGAIIRQRSS